MNKAIAFKHIDLMPCVVFIKYLDLVYYWILVAIKCKNENKRVSISQSTSAASTPTTPWSIVIIIPSS